MTGVVSKTFVDTGVDALLMGGITLFLAVPSDGTTGVICCARPRLPVRFPRYLAYVGSGTTIEGRVWSRSLRYCPNSTV
jgi:hypothetical protein